MNKREYFEELERDVLPDEFFIGRSKGDIDIETRTNTWGFEISKSLAESMTTEEWERFLKRVIEDRERRIVEAQAGHGMIFYLWYDEQSGGLRFSFISEFHRRLPFGANLVPVESPRPIILRFLEDYRSLPDDLDEEDAEGEREPEEPMTEAETEELAGWLQGIAAMEEEEPGPPYYLPVYAVRVPPGPLDLTYP